MREYHFNRLPAFTRMLQPLDRHPVDVRIKQLQRRWITINTLPHDHLSDSLFPSDFDFEVTLFDFDVLKIEELADLVC